MFNHKHCVKAGLLASAIALTGCGSSSSSSSDNSPAAGRSGEPVSNLSISAKGGQSTLGEGGHGGYVEIFKTNSAKNLNIVKEGNIDTSYTLPAQTPEFGVNPAVIDTTQTITLIDGPVETPPAAGTLYMIPNNYRLFKSNGEKLVADESHEVTGLTVNAGATLFLPANNGTTRTQLYFNNDVQNDGVITTVNGSYDNRIDLSLTAAAYYATGDINLKGDTANRYRQSGGDLELNAYTIINSGLINTSGANKSNENNTGNGGGNAGSINLSAIIFIETTGELRANGGSSDTNFGTNGADIYLSAGAIINTGLVNSNSGSGDDQNHTSNSSDITFYAQKSILNTGTISSKGADAGDMGDAGKGGDIKFYLNQNSEIALSQSIINTGDLIVDGGSIIGESDDYAGNGGSISIYTQSSNDAAAGTVVFEISGNLSANGGSTIEEYSDAGNGGSIYIANYDNPSSTSETFLIGYNEINTSGGQGLDAGSAGSIDIEFADYRDERNGGNFVPTLTGSIFNNANLIANGGNTTAEAQAAGLDPIYGSGKSGGDVIIKAFNYSAYLQPGAINVTNKGSISVNGGDSYRDSYRSNANGGEVNISASHKIDVTQPVTLNGGSDLHVATTGESNNHSGSDAGEVFMSSQYDQVIFNSDLSANGGTGDLLGGHGGFLNVISKNAVELTGSISLNGANTADSEVDGLETEGGNAGIVYVLAESMDSNVNATITSNAGNGDQPGEEKIILVDADCLSNNCQLPF